MSEHWYSWLGKQTLAKKVKDIKDCLCWGSLRLTSAISTFLSHVLMVFSRSAFKIFSRTYTITCGERNSASCLRSFLFTASALARSWVGKDQLNQESWWFCLLDLMALTSLPSFRVFLKIMLKFSMKWEESQDSDDDFFFFLNKW